VRWRLVGGARHMVVRCRFCGAVEEIGWRCNGHGGEVKEIGWSCKAHGGEVQVLW